LLRSIPAVAAGNDAPHDLFRFTDIAGPHPEKMRVIDGTGCKEPL
jgi:hypothetical protein